MKFYIAEDYNLTELEEKIIKVIANKDNYFPTAYAKASDGKTNLHMQTLDARKATKAVTKLLKELNLIK